LLDGGRPERHLAHVDQRHPGRAVVHGGHADDGPVLRPPVELLVRPAGVGQLRQPHLDQELVGPQDRLQEAREELGGGDLAAPGRALGHDGAAQGQDGGGQVGGRVAVGQRAAQGAAVADLGVADEAGHMGQERHLRLQHVGGLQLPVPGEGADGHLVALLADVGEVGEPADVDDHGRRGQPQPHQRQQRVAAGHQLGVVAVLDQEVDGLVGRLGPDVVEGDGDHASAPFVPGVAGTSACPPVMAAHTRAGEAGMRTSVTPRGRRASTTALITAAAEPMVPASPIPFTPSWLLGLGVTVLSSSKLGRSGADGTR
jgi:hypothetical protein